MSWLTDRLHENSTQTALIPALASVLAFAGGTLTLPGLVASLATSLVAILTPNNSQAGAQGAAAPPVPPQAG